jgi:O-methyltransferase
MVRRSDKKIVLFPREEHVVIRAMLHDAVSHPAVNLYEKEEDYCRYRALELICEQVGDLPGSVAEAGVFYGSFAFMINHCFPDRKLFLYDTFEGACKEDVDSDLEEQYITPELFASDSVPFYISDADLDPMVVIREKCPHPEKLVFRKGYFPETTAPDIDEKFAFVSLDMNLYKPMRAALEFFYPRLHEGGSSSCTTIIMEERN